MSPQYFRINGLDESHSPLAAKYSLYLYREQGHSSDLNGTPILFIPGNAGSYKQVRSIASLAADVDANLLDFFSADFNEDFTAFHGKTMLDQAYYLNDAIRFILSLYSNRKNPPKSVILIAHSMGGIVSRVLFTLPNYIDGSVNTILTLATPHAAAPTTFDGDLLDVYNNVDNFWRDSFYSNKTQNVLIDVAIISINGGVVDTTLPSDYTKLDSLVPLSNGFTVSTTGIPQVWTPIDHLAIVWCQQLRYVLAHMISEIIDIKSPYRSLPIDERMDVFRRWLLPSTMIEVPSSKHRAIVKFDYNQLKENSNQQMFQASKKIVKRGVDPYKLNAFYISPNSGKLKFNLISSMKPMHIDASNELAPKILLCKNIEDSSKSLQIFDYVLPSSSPQQIVELDCTSITSVTPIPKSLDGVQLFDSSFGGSQNPFYSLEIPYSILMHYNSVIIVDPTIKSEFLVADINPESVCTESQVPMSLWSLITRGVDITLPAHRCSIFNINIPTIKSGLLAYNLDVRYKKGKFERFSPLISQSVNSETKWHIDISHNQNLKMLINGENPYVPINHETSGVVLKVFSDTISTNVDEIMDIYISVDWYNSMSLLFLKYRLSIIGFPLFVALSVFIIQLLHWMYWQPGFFPSFGYGLNKLCHKKFLISSFIIFSLLGHISSSNKFIDLLDPVKNPNWYLLPKGFTINWKFLGIDDFSLWFYGPCMLYISWTLNFLVYSFCILIMNIIENLNSYSYLFFYSYLFPNSKYTNNQSAKSNILKKTFDVAMSIFTNIINYFFHKLGLGFTIPARLRKLLGVMMLTVLVLLYLPYQFAYLVSVITHIIGLFRMSLKDKSTKTIISNQKNFNVSFLMLLLWVLPLHIPILLVWLHNLSLKWSTPFSSHHNIMAVFPIILVVLTCNRGIESDEEHKPKPNGCFYLLLLLLVYTAIYCVLFGTRHLFFIHELFDLICFMLLWCWLTGTFGGSLKKAGLMGFTRGWREKEP
ncbi:Bst1 protein [Martiniozyma asiatica (nom. inval.)]|nr:Bst1 protein [Martiniozyma asiatica]